MTYSYASAPGVVKTASVSLNITYVTVSSTDSVVLNANPLRRYLAIFNRDIGSADIAFGSVAVSGQSLPIAAASALGSADGGGFVFGSADAVDQRDVHAVSSVGTSLVIVEGV